MSTRAATRIGRSCLWFIGKFQRSPRTVIILTKSRGEPGIGRWTVVVKDHKMNEHNGTFTDWRITLWGESIDGSKQQLFPMPTDEDDDDHDAIPAHVATTSLSAIVSQTELPIKPTDHIDRPVNAKPTSAVLSTTSGVTSPTSASSSQATDSPKPAYILPSIFPTFGVSPRTQIWIYGAFATIVLFCIALGVFFCVWRRRCARTNGADYEFEMLDDQDTGAGVPLNANGRRVKRRAGELYDAFAGESDEEIFSEGEEEYKDEDPGIRKGSGSPKKESEK